jgi:transcriptional regulator with XRE-family HTH domain
VLRDGAEVFVDSVATTGGNDLTMASHVSGMTHAVDSKALKREMFLRGWTGVDLARESRLSAATVSAALAGKPIAVASVILIAQALMRCPMVAMVESLLPEETPQRKLPTRVNAHPKQQRPRIENSNTWSLV